MAERKRIGLIFSYNEGWIAGSYYILNIIHALKTLPTKERPIVVILSEARSNYNRVVQETQYPFLEFLKYPLEMPSYFIWERIVNKVFLTLFNFKPINKKKKKANIDFMYPYVIEDITVKSLPKVNWVPDFQEIHLPHLFSKEAREQRRKHQEEILCTGDWLVFSSLDAQKDFQNLYTEAAVAQFVLPFAVTHPNFKKLSLSKLLKKYSLPKVYFFSPNQFWAHKNHITILKAIYTLKLQGINVHVAFSGKEDDSKNEDYVSLLKLYIKEHNLENEVHFLGFMPRMEQLKLMEHAVAVIQPSTFEGWSTVVEDAKALNQFVILSDIQVHLEQMKRNVHFFPVESSEALSKIMKIYWETPPVKEDLEYNKAVNKFAKDFMKLVDTVIYNY